MDKQALIGYRYIVTSGLALSIPERWRGGKKKRTIIVLQVIVESFQSINISHISR